MPADPRHRSRLRVLTLVDGIGTYGGGERLARDVTLTLDRERFEPAFCLSREVPPAELALGRKELDAAGVPLLELGRESRFDLAAWRPLVAFARRRGVDVLHSHKIGSNIWAALLKGRMGSPVFVAQEHTWSFEGQPYRRFIDRNLIARRADAFVAVSEADRRRMIEIERIPAAKLRFVPNGIPAFPSPDRSDEVRSELGIEPGWPVIGVVAALRPQKALDLLIRATPALHGEFPDIRVLIAGGEGGAIGQRERLEGIARDLGVAGNVELLGDRDDVPDLLRAVDVAVLSSDYEGSPLSVLEYMEAAKPVVTRRYEELYEELYAARAAGG